MFKTLSHSHISVSHHHPQPARRHGGGVVFAATIEKLLVSGLAASHRQKCKKSGEKVGQ